MREDTNTVIGNEQVDTVTYGIDHQKIEERLWTLVNKFNNLNEMDRFLECWSKLTQGKTEKFDHSYT